MFLPGICIAQLSPISELLTFHLVYIMGIEFSGTKGACKASDDPPLNGQKQNNGSSACMFTHSKALRTHTNRGCSLWRVARVLCARCEQSCNVTAYKGQYIMRMHLFPSGNRFLSNCVMRYISLSSAAPAL
jgi:hypothetical protein